RLAEPSPRLRRVALARSLVRGPVSGLFGPHWPTHLERGSLPTDERCFRSRRSAAPSPAPPSFAPVASGDRCGEGGPERRPPRRPTSPACYARDLNAVAGGNGSAAGSSPVRGDPRLKLKTLALSAPLRLVWTLALYIGVNVAALDWLGIGRTVG